MQSYDMGPPSIPPDISNLQFDEIVESMVSWFFTNFEDPAEHTPYESAEGGYQFIWGGPCDAREELEDAFGVALEKLLGEQMQQRAIKAAVDRIEEDGWEWAPSESRMRPEEDPDPDNVNEDENAD